MPWASQTQAAQVEVLRSWCMTMRRQRSFQACVRSTPQRLGRTTKPRTGSCQSDCCASCRVPVKQLPGLRTTSTRMRCVCLMALAQLHADAQRCSHSAWPRRQVFVARPTCPELAALASNARCLAHARFCGWSQCRPATRRGDRVRQPVRQALHAASARRSGAAGRCAAAPRPRAYRLG